MRTFYQINEYYFPSGSFDCTIKICWEINNWKFRQTLVGHNSKIISLISLKYKNKNNANDLISSCSNDRSIRIWEGSI